MNITGHAVRRRIATSAIVVALLVMGFLGLASLPVNFLPDMTYPLIKVHIWWRGATPDEIDKSIADPVERQMATVDDLDYLESSSIEGMYTLQANFRYGANIDAAYQSALAAMSRAARNLPKDIDPPFIVKADPSALPVVQVTINSDEWDLVKLRTWADDWLQDQLLATPGVAGTEIVGGLKREIRVLLDPDALEKCGLTLSGVIARLRDENVEQFGGRVTTGPKEIIARTVGEYRSLDEIRSIVLARNEGAKVYLRDIADVQDAHEEVRVITRLGGKPCVKLSVLKQANANTVTVARAVSQRIRELQPVLPAGLRLGMVENQADYVTTALVGVRNAALEAILLLIIVVFLFLGSWRQVLVIIVALPLALVLNFGLMKLAGFSLNIFSLGGLVIATAILLDNSIVVIENITRQRHARPASPSDKVTIEATGEVGAAVVAATVAFLALFVPFLLVPGLTSLLFHELILVIAGIVVISLAVALTVTPMLTALLLGRGETGPRRATWFERLFARVTDAYGTALKRVLSRRRLIAIASLVVLIVVIVLMGKLGSEFLPKMDDGRVFVKAKLPTGAAVGETDRVLREVEERIAGDRLVESYYTLVGGKIWGLATYEIANEGEVNIQLVPRHSRKLSTQGYIQKLRPVVAQISVPGGNVMVTQTQAKGIRKMGESDIEVRVKGQDVTFLYDLARKTASTMNDLKHFTNVYVAVDMNKPEYQVQVDRTRAAELGLSVADVANALRSLVTGAVATQYRDGDEYYNLRVLVPEDKVASRQDIENLPLSTARGGYVRVRDVAEVRPAAGPVEIIREDQVKVAVVRADAAGVSVGVALSELKAALAKLDRPTGYEFTYGGQAILMADMQKALLAVLVLAAFLAFIALAVQFNNLKLPALILGSVPFCLAGSILMLLITGLPLGATVIIGVLVVVAATVNEGVLLMTFAEELQKAQGLSPSEAVTAAAKIRLRPRVMITVAALAAFIPLVLGLEAGGEMLQPMAAAAVGGLLFAIPVSLFLMPALYVMFTRVKAA